MSSKEGIPPVAPVVRPTPEERNQLRLFIRCVDEMSGCRFIHSYRQQKQSVSCQVGDDGEPQISAPKYDWEDFQSFLTRFRQVAFNKRDRPSIRLETILGIVQEYGSPFLRSKLAPIRQYILPILDGHYYGVRLARYNAAGDPEYSLTTYQMLNALVNGQIFHPDARFQEEITFLNTAERWQYLFIILSEIIIPTLRACLWLFKAMRVDGILDDADYPAHCPRPQWPWPDQGSLALT